MPHVNRQHVHPDDPGDIDSLDRPDWLKARVREMQRTAAAGKKSVFATAGTMPPHELRTGRNGKEVRGEVAAIRDTGGNGNVPENFPEILLRLRRQRRLSQGALARLSGIPDATISDLEHGLYEPRLSQIRALARALAVPPAELVPPGG